jgi:hypothetical protein
MAVSCFLVQQRWSSGAVRSHRRQGHEGNDDGQEAETRVDGAKSETAVFTRLRQQIAQRRAERPRENVGDPEGQDGIGAEVVRRRNYGDERAEREDAEIEAETERFGRQVPRGGAERKCEQDRPPVKLLAARRDDRVNRQCSLHRVPDRKNRCQDRRECCGADVEADVQTVGQCIGDLSSDDADQDHRQPVNPRHVASRAHLHDQRCRQKRSHHGACERRAKSHVHGEIVGAGFTDGRRHYLDDPEGQRNRRYLVQHAGDARVRMVVHRSSPFHEVEFRSPSEGQPQPWVRGHWWSWLSRHLAKQATCGGDGWRLLSQR